MLVKTTMFGDRFEILVTSAVLYIETVTNFQMYQRMTEVSNSD